MDPISFSPPPGKAAIPFNDASQSAFETNHTSEFKQAFDYWTNGHSGLAQASYKKILSSDPENKEARYLSGLIKKGITDPIQYFDNLYRNQSGSVPGELPGDEEAYTVGLLFLKGSGPEQCDKKAACFFIAAGTKGESKLEEMYQQGRCIKEAAGWKIINERHTVLSSCSNTERSKFQFLLGQAYQNASLFPDAIPYLSEAVEAGYPGALDVLADALCSCPTRQRAQFNQEKVEKYFKHAADKLGHKGAAFAYAEILSARERLPGGANRLAKEGLSPRQYYQMADDYEHPGTLPGMMETSPEKMPGPPNNDVNKIAPEMHKTALKNAGYHVKNGALEIAKALFLQIPGNTEVRYYLDLLNDKKACGYLIKLLNNRAVHDFKTAVIHCSALLLADNPQNHEARGYLNLLRDTAGYKELCVKAGQNDIDANYTLGIMHREGAGAELNREMADAYLLASEFKKAFDCWTKGDVETISALLLTIASWQAFDCWTKGDVETARSTYEQILASDSENNEAHYFLGLLKEEITNPMQYFDALYNSRAENLTTSYTQGFLYNRTTDIPSVRPSQEWLEEVYKVGLMFLEGAGLEQNDEQAARFLHASQDLGKEKLKEMYLQGRCITQVTCHEAISTLFITIVGNTNQQPHIQFLLGRTYLEAGSFHNAIMYLIPAVKVRYPGALDLLAQALCRCPQNERSTLNQEEVEKYLKQAADESGHKEAAFEYAQILDQRESQPGFAGQLSNFFSKVASQPSSTYYYQIASNAGHPFAHIKIWEKSYEKTSDPQIAFNIGTYYLNAGQNSDLATPPEKTVTYLEKAAGYLRIAEAAKIGEGTTALLLDAESALLKAKAANNDGAAAYQLHKVVVDFQEKFKYLDIAARNGIDEAAQLLFHYHYDKNKDKALEYLKMAATTNRDVAYTLFRELLGDINPDHVAKKQGHSDNDVPLEAEKYLVIAAQGDHQDALKAYSSLVNNGYNLRNKSDEILAKCAQLIK